MTNSAINFTVPQLCTSNNDDKKYLGTWDLKPINLDTIAHLSAVANAKLEVLDLVDAFADYPVAIGVSVSPKNSRRENIPIFIYGTNKLTEGDIAVILVTLRGREYHILTHDSSLVAVMGTALNIQRLNIIRIKYIHLTGSRDEITEGFVCSILASGHDGADILQRYNEYSGLLHKSWDELRSIHDLTHMPIVHDGLYESFSEINTILKAFEYEQFIWWLNKIPKRDIYARTLFISNLRNWISQVPNEHNLVFKNENNIIGTVYFCTIAEIPFTDMAVLLSNKMSDDILSRTVALSLYRMYLVGVHSLSESVALLMAYDADTENPPWMEQCNIETPNRHHMKLIQRLITIEYPLTQTSQLGNTEYLNPVLHANNVLKYVGVNYCDNRITAGVKKYLFLMDNLDLSKTRSRQTLTAFSYMLLKILKSSYSVRVPVVSAFNQLDTSWYLQLSLVEKQNYVKTITALLEYTMKYEKSSKADKNQDDVFIEFNEYAKKPGIFLSGAVVKRTIMSLKMNDYFGLTSFDTTIYNNMTKECKCRSMQQIFKAVKSEYTEKKLSVDDFIKYFKFAIIKFKGKLGNGALCIDLVGLSKKNTYITDKNTLCIYYSVADADATIRHISLVNISHKALVQVIIMLVHDYPVCNFLNESQFLDIDVAFKAYCEWVLRAAGERQDYVCPVSSNQDQCESGSANNITVGGN